MGSDWVVSLLPKETALGFYDVWMPLVYKALPHDEWDLDALLRDIRQETSAVFIVHQGSDIAAAGVLQIIDYPLCRKLRIFALGGSGMDQWQLRLDEFFDAYARHVNASGIEIVGRKGFSRVLKPLGYEERYVVLEKEVRHGEGSGRSKGGFHPQPGTVPTALH